MTFCSYTRSGLDLITSWSQLEVSRWVRISDERGKVGSQTDAQNQTMQNKLYPNKTQNKANNYGHPAGWLTI